MIFWTDEATQQYLKRANDLPVQHTYSDLVALIEERPDAGWTVSDLLAGPRADATSERIAARVRHSLEALPLPETARVVVGMVPRPTGALPPPLLGVVVHIRGAPEGTGCDHTVLTMGTIARPTRSPLS